MITQLCRLSLLVACVMMGPAESDARACYYGGCPGSGDNCTYWYEDCGQWCPETMETLCYTVVFACTGSSDVFYEYSYQYCTCGPGGPNEGCSGCTNGACCPGSPHEQCGIL